MVKAIAKSRDNRAKQISQLIGFCILYQTGGKIPEGGGWIC